MWAFSWKSRSWILEVVCQNSLSTKEVIWTPSYAILPLQQKQEYLYCELMGFWEVGEVWGSPPVEKEMILLWLFLLSSFSDFSCYWGWCVFSDVELVRQIC